MKYDSNDNRTFERATQHVGLDYFSHPLWDKYLEWEQSQNELRNVLKLYHRILDIPLEKASSYFER
jgi:pre-mRNA-processing factor 39